MSEFEKNQTIEGFTPGEFMKIVAPGPVKERQAGWIKGPISIHETYAFDDLEGRYYFTWHISHVATGYKIATFGDKGQAFSFADYCQHFKAWDEVTDEKPELDEKFAKKIKLIRDIMQDNVKFDDEEIQKREGIE